MGSRICEKLWGRMLGRVRNWSLLLSGSFDSHSVGRSAFADNNSFSRLPRSSNLGENWGCLLRKIAPFLYQIVRLEQEVAEETEPEFFQLTLAEGTEHGNRSGVFSFHQLRGPSK